MGVRMQQGRQKDQRSRRFRRARRANQPKFRPQLEALEMRTLMAGFWTQLQTSNPTQGPADGSQSAVLLSNGKVLVAQDTAPGANGGSSNLPQTTWFPLSPTTQNNYVNGSWNPSATMNTARVHFPSAMLRDGRLFVIGGEFSPGLSNINAPEIYDPVTNTWTPVPPMPSPPTQLGTNPPASPQSQFGDAAIATLDNGEILAGWFNGPETFIYNPNTNSWRPITGIPGNAGKKLRDDNTTEENWVKLPDGSILSYDVEASLTDNTFHAQRFIPFGSPLRQGEAADSWNDASKLDPVNPPGLLNSTATFFGGTLGPGVLLPDGRVMWFGGNGTTAFYDPDTDLWSKGPDQPFVSSQISGFQQFTAADTPAAVLPNGKVLVAMSPEIFGNSVSPTLIFEFDPQTNIFTDVTPTFLNNNFFNGLQFSNANEFRMLLLPTGQVLMSSVDVTPNSIFGTPDLVYTPDLAPLDVWRPTIKSLTDNQNGTFTLSGTQLTGITEGSYFGDDSKNASNYPILRVQDKSGNILYARTFNWSETSLQTGNKLQTTQFVLPGGSTRLTDFTHYTVIVNGIPSKPFDFFPIAPQTISGIKFDDVNGDGVRNVADGIYEAAVPKVYIYLDLNNDGKMSITEPAAVSDNFGRWTIKDVPPGTYRVRELIPPGASQTMPGPSAATPFAHVVTVLDRPITDIFFGDTINLDFGDAPASYGTLKANDGPRHGLVAGFRLGSKQDAERDAKAPLNGTGDDITGLDDEDGVAISALTPGQGITPGLAAASVTVSVSLGGNAPGKLQGWIDFNRNGRFDANEKIISNRVLGAGTTVIPINVPTTAVLGPTFARFRYAYENDLGPTGASIAGEVEDYGVTIFPSTPVANDDRYGFTDEGQAAVKQGETAVLDVLANDLGTAAPGGLDIVTNDPASSFPNTLPSGSTVAVVFNAALGHDVIEYTPALSVQGPETFTYRAMDNSNPPRISNVATVTVNVSLRKPVAIDNTYTEPTPTVLPLSVNLKVMSNDLFALGSGAQILPGSIVPLMLGQPLLTINADQVTLDFNAPIGFQGTAIYQYQITDSDGEISDPAFVTVQVVDGGLNASPADLFADGYFGEVSFVLLDPLNNDAETTELMVGVGDVFNVRVFARDLREEGAPGDTSNRGLESVFMDMLLPLFRDANGVQQNFIEPISIVPNPQYTQNGNFNLDQFSTGLGDELGGEHNSASGGVGPGAIEVYTVQFRAIQSTNGVVGETGPDGSVQIIADPPDTLQDEITQMPDPPILPLLPLISFSEPPFTDENPPQPNPNQAFDVFFRQSGNLIIFGQGQGEFVNRSNAVDVNMDGSVSLIDAMTVVNYINSFGSQSLVGKQPVVHDMIDTNWDSRLSLIDAMNVVNYINAQRRHTGIQTLTRAMGEGESSSAADTDLALLSTSGDTGTTSSNSTGTNSVLLTSSSNNTTTAPSGSTSSSTSSSSTTSSTTTSSTTTKTVDANAADELFALNPTFGGKKWVYA